MQWNAAIFIKYSLPIPGREADAMKLFTDGLALWGKLAADGLCSEPEVFHHRDGGGFMFVRTESVDAADSILDDPGPRHHRERAGLHVATDPSPGHPSDD